MHYTRFALLVALAIFAPFGCSRADHSDSRATSSLVTAERPNSSANDVVLSSAEVQTFTKDHQKDHDTSVWFFLLPRFDDREIADYQDAVADTGILGTNPDSTWPNCTANGPFQMKLNPNMPALRKADWPNAWLYIGGKTNGSNNWHFDAHLRLHWSDGSPMTQLVINDMQWQRSSTKWPNGGQPNDPNTGWIKLGRDMQTGDSWWGGDGPRDGPC